MPSLLTLPPELLEGVLGLLGKADLKKFRRVSHECTPYATPLVFQKISIDLEPGGCDGLVSIARTPNLAQHVGTIHLERRNGLKTFDSFEDWRSAIVNQCDLFADKNPAPSSRPQPALTSQAHWLVLNEDKLRALHEEYEVEKEKRTLHAAQLAKVASSILFPGSLSAAQLGSHTSEAAIALRNFITSVSKLSAVESITYVPAFEDEARWGRSWRNLHFNPRASVSEVESGVDPDMDALQLFIVIRTLLLAPNLLHSVEVYSRGHAFWSAPHLRRLLD
ncbi:hypothetical protein LTR17_022307 [Elasticomyces elasticus]|nr:hypothetical protein LTR17_022307 [Elasticomyces elasticus]